MKPLARINFAITLTGVIFALPVTAAGQSYRQSLETKRLIAVGSDANQALPTLPMGPQSGQVVFASQAEPANRAVETELTSEAIASELAAIEAAVEIADELKSECSERLKMAAKWLQDEQVAIARKVELEAQIAAVPQQLELAKYELNRPALSVAIELPAGATIAQLETKLSERRQQAEADEAVSKARGEECENRATRYSEVTKEIVSCEKKIADALEQLKILTDDDVIGRAKRLEQRARYQARMRQMAVLKLEQHRLKIIAELAPMQRDIAMRTAVYSGKLLQKWQDAVDSWRKEESKRQANEARRVAENSHPALKSLATKNAEIAELRIQTAAEIERLAGIISHIEKSSKTLGNAFDNLREKVEHAGTTASTGILLLTQRSELPPAVEYRKRAEFVNKATQLAHLKAMELNQLRSQMADPVEMAGQMLDSFKESLADYDQNEVLAVLTRLLNDRRDFLDKASADQNTYLQDLNELELVNNAAAEQVAEFRHYLDQRVMWIRSADPISISDTRKAARGMAALLSPAPWLEVFRVGGGEIVKRPAGGIAVVAFFLLLFYGKARLLVSQSRLIDQATSSSGAKYWNNIAAVGVAAVLSAKWPILFSVVGFRLRHATGSTAWTNSVGETCLFLALFVWGWDGLKEICRKQGVGERLFRWPIQATAAVRHMLELSYLLCMPGLAIFKLARLSVGDSFAGLERVMFIAMMLLCGCLFAILLRPKGRLITGLGMMTDLPLVYSTASMFRYGLRRLLRLWR